jgi:hypothetical protein
VAAASRERGNVPEFPAERVVRRAGRNGAAPSPRFFGAGWFQIWREYSLTAAVPFYFFCNQTTPKLGRNGSVLFGSSTKHYLSISERGDSPWK